MTRIVQVANFVTPTSGGLRTTLEHLAAGYADHGIDVVQVVPGPADRVERTSWGRRVQVAGPAVPTTGYRLLTDVEKVMRLLDAFAPDRLEVHDRTTMRRAGTWALAEGVPSLVVSHERLDRWLQQWLSPRLPLPRLADASNTALVDSFDSVLCTTAWAAEEFERIGAPNLLTVPLGVDLEGFPARVHRSDAPEVLLLMASRLSKEKRPELAVECVRELVRRGLPVRLLAAGSGPMQRRLERVSAGLPVHWLGFVQARTELAALLAAADVVLAPGPAETFGLAALEALASGTPVVYNRHSALPEVVGEAGRAAASSGFVMADCVEELLGVDEVHRRTLARRRAEQFSWQATVQGFLAAHGLVRAQVRA